MVSLPRGVIPTYTFCLIDDADEMHALNLVLIWGFFMLATRSSIHGIGALGFDVCSGDTVACAVSQVRILAFVPFAIGESIVACAVGDIRIFAFCHDAPMMMFL